MAVKRINHKAWMILDRSLQTIRSKELELAQLRALHNEMLESYNIDPNGSEIVDNDGNVLSRPASPAAELTPLSRKPAEDVDG